MKSTNVNENGYAFQQEFFCETLVSPAVVSDAMCALIGPRGKPKSIESMFKTSGTASKKWCSGESGKIKLSCRKEAARRSVSFENNVNPDSSLHGGS